MNSSRTRASVASFFSLMLAFCCTVLGSTPAVAADEPGLTPQTVMSPTDNRLEAVAPQRVVDTRHGTGVPSTGKLGAGRILTFTTGQLPSSAHGSRAIMVNVTVVDPDTDGWLTARVGKGWNSNTSFLNFRKGQTISNQAILVPADDMGEVALTTSSRTHVIVDLEAYHPRYSGFTAVRGERLLDTRKTRPAPTAGATRSVRVLGVAGVPSMGVSAVAVNVTAVDPRDTGWLTVWPTGATKPVASNVNYRASDRIAGLTFAKVGANGQISVGTSASSDVLVDVVGWMPSTPEYVSVNPSRLLDTRSGLGAARSRVPAGGKVTLKVTGRGGVPQAGVTGVELNVAAVSPRGNGWLTTWPTGLQTPNVSVLSYSNGVTTANSVTAALGGDGTVTISSSAEADLIVDVTGWWMSNEGGASQVAAGDFYTCMRSVRGTVRCWGSNYDGELSGGTTTGNASATPRPVLNIDGPVRSLDASDSLTCVVTAAGAVRCWGKNPLGVPSDGISGPSSAIVPGLESGVRQMAVARSGGCAVTDSGVVKCWGDNQLGQLGSGSDVTGSATAAEVPGLDAPATKVVTGAASACALLTTGGVKCWGYNGNGQLGTGDTISSNAPVTVQGLATGVADITLGNMSACARLASGAVKCWGDNEDGQLANGTYANALVPTDTTGLDGAAEVRLGHSFGCARMSDGTVRCWGANYRYQLGRGGQDGAHSPVPAPVQNAGAGVASLGLGRTHACITTNIGGVRCWGSTSLGELGQDGGPGPESEAIAVTGL